jgi:hypothetical protein
MEKSSFLYVSDFMEMEINQNFLMNKINLNGISEETAAIWWRKLMFNVLMEIRLDYFCRSVGSSRGIKLSKIYWLLSKFYYFSLLYSFTIPLVY